LCFFRGNKDHDGFLAKYLERRKHNKPNQAISIFDGKHEAANLNPIAPIRNDLVMHDTALANGERFFATYASRIENPLVIDLGSQDVNGSLKSFVTPGMRYVGVDFMAAKGVDVIIDDPYSLPFPDGSVDIVVSSSCFEHSEMFWLLFLEIQRILKPTGLLYLNVPSNGMFHRYPVDCWRFYPDSGNALARWARRSGYKTSLLESFTSEQELDAWNDYVCVFVKDEAHCDHFTERMISLFKDYTNALSYPNLTDYLNPATYPQDVRRGIISRVGFQLRRTLKGYK
jgi:SAM-dependent methyltransferase